MLEAFHYRVIDRRIGLQCTSFPGVGTRWHFEGNDLLSKWNELLSKWNQFDAECKWRVLEGNQFHSGCNEFHSEGNSLASESNSFHCACNEFHSEWNSLVSGWNSFHLDTHQFDARSNERRMKRRYTPANTRTCAAALRASAPRL